MLLTETTSYSIHRRFNAISCGICSSALIHCNLQWHDVEISRGAKDCKQPYDIPNNGRYVEERNTSTILVSIQINTCYLYKIFITHKID